MTGHRGEERQPTQREQHTRGYDPKNGPAFCQECSEAAQAWVTWPCGYVRATEAITRAVDAILDIDAHATPLGEDGDGFVDGGYLVTVGAMHRALGVVGHTAPPCRFCATGTPCVEFRTQAAAHYQRESLEALCKVAGIEHEGRANFYLLDDLLDHIGGPGTSEARWATLRGDTIEDAAEVGERSADA